jgi:hypothetical protein
MTEIVFQESMYVLYLLVKIHKNPQGKRQGGLKHNITEMEALIKVSSVGLSDRKSAVTKYVCTWYSG